MSEPPGANGRRTSGANGRRTSGATRLAGLFGFPARHSLSPVLHTAAYAEMGLDATYVTFPVEPALIGTAVHAVKALDLLGVSVTMPHKEAVIPYLDALSPEAETLQAVNTIVRVGDDLVGHNTDGAGFLAALLEGASFDPTQKTCVVVGAGGAARAVALALAGAGVGRLYVVARNSERAATVATLAGNRGAVASEDVIEAADLVVNATPVGMHDTVDDVPFDPTLCHAGQVVNDLIYAPRTTRLLREAAEADAVPVNGMGMLLHQAAAQIELWTGQPAPVNAMRAAFPPEPG